MDRAMRNYLLRRHILAPVLTVSTGIAAAVGLVCPALRKYITQPVFIVGCSRSGTTLFAEVFGTRQDIWKSVV